MSTAESDVFMLKSVPELKDYLKQRGIPLSQDGKVRRKRDLANLCAKADELKVAKQSENEDLRQNLKLKALTTFDGVLTLPSSGWNNDFTNISLTFADIFIYLVAKDDYSTENLKSFKSLTGYKLAASGNVLDLKKTIVEQLSNYTIVNFKVKPTQRSVIKDEGENTNSYSGFIVLTKCGTVHSAYCVCKGASDGACRHIAAALFELEFTLNKNISCTSVKCTWNRRAVSSDCKKIKVKDMDVQKLEYGKQSSKSSAASRLETPVSTEYLDMTVKLAEGLRKCYPDSVWLQYAPIPEPVEVNEESTEMNICNNLLVDHEETVDYVEVYSMEEYAQMYKVTHQFQSVNESVCHDFLAFITSSFGEEQTKAIFENSRDQSQCSFWFDQRKGRITASIFYKICHLKSTTDPTVTLTDIFQYKLRMNSNNLPAALEWGRQREAIAAELYHKKLRTKHQNMVLELPGLHVCQTLPYLGASPDRIRRCDCCSPCLVEIKSKYTKKNLVPKVASADEIEEINGCLHVKEECSWNYQCQGQMALTGIHKCDLVIYTLKGILIVNIQFDPDKWKDMKEKLLNFFQNNIAPELLTGKIKSATKPEQ